MQINRSTVSRSVLLVGTLCALALPALAQTVPPISSPRGAPRPVTLSARDTMSRSLVAVQTVTLLRDRGVLDEAQRGRIAMLERDLVAALAAHDAVPANAGPGPGPSQGGAQGQARLEQARHAFNAEVTTLAAANQGLLREIEALRSDTIAQASRLSDEEVHQRQRFADGDIRALDIMEILATQREAAIDRAAKERRAESRRDMARNFAIAVGRGSPGRTSTDVLARWDEAAAIDPTDFWTHIERAKLAQVIGDLARARGAAQDGLNAARTDRQRSAAQIEIGAIAMLQGDLVAAAKAFAISHVIAKEHAATNPGSGQAARDVYVTLIKVGDVAERAGNLTMARSSFSQSSTFARWLSDANPSSASVKRDLLSILQRLGALAIRVSDLAAAQATISESLTIARALSSAEPNSLSAKRDMSISLNTLGDIALSKGDLATARAAFNESLAIARVLSAADPSSAEAKRHVSIGLIKMGDMAISAGEPTAASTAFAESLIIDRALSAADPRSAQAKRDVGLSLMKLAQIPTSNVRWAEVAAHWRAMKRDGMLAASDEPLLAQIEQKAAQEATPPTMLLKP